MISWGSFEVLGKCLGVKRKMIRFCVSLQQLKEIKNIGPRIASHIMEIIETGEMEKNKELTHNDQGSIAMSLFVNIHGVGTKTAQRWVQMVSLFCRVSISRKETCRRLGSLPPIATV